MIDVRKLSLNKSSRIIITSDVHGNLNLLKKLLHKISFSEADYLFINGDLCEKGPNSLEVVDFVRNMVKESSNVFITKGNCDVVHRYVMSGNEGILPYIRERKHSILNEMMSLHHKTIDDFQDITELADFYLANFQDMLTWLDELPEAYELEDCIIIHAGITNGNDWHDTDSDTALYTKAFHEQEHQVDKHVIVGHWPVVNYRSDLVSSHSPIIDLKKRIISIDGGNQIKKDGQLNALIIEDGEYNFTYVDDLEQEVQIKKDYQDSYNRIGTVTYPNYKMSILETGEYFTKCENINLGTTQWIKNEYLTEKDGQTYCKDDLSTTFLTVKTGQTVKLIDNQCKGYILVKNSTGEVGWIPRECM